MEEKVKKRGWVKNVAIIFLVALLFLTFMSNTIRNASLPEVAAQYVSSGTISAKIRGSGVVTANESYEVKTGQTRTVQSVLVKVGDVVATDDVLLTFADMESKELTDAEAALEALMTEYKTALVDITDPDYAAENAAITQAQAALDKARTDRSALAVSDAEQANAQWAVTNAKDAVIRQQAEVARLEAQLSAAPPGGTTAEINIAQQKVDEKNSELVAARNDLASTRIVYDDMYNLLTEYAWRLWAERTGGSTVNQPSESILRQYREAAAKAYKDDLNIKTATSSGSPKAAKSSLVYPTREPTDEEKGKMVTAYDAVSGGQDKINTVQKELSALHTALEALQNNEHSRINTKLTNAKAELTRLQDEQKAAEEHLATIKSKQTEYKTADAAVTAAEVDLQNKMIALAEKQKADGKSQSKEQIALADKQYKMAQQNKVIQKLRENATGANMKSPVNGKVTAVGITAGGTTSPDAALVTIEVPDRGYSLSFSVTTEASKKVSVGDTADISYYYGTERTATLAGIKSDPDKPTTNKLLVFKLDGDVQAGEQMSLSIGEKGQYYETIVPNSAIKNDNNGSFVLIVEAKSSPLGNRYIARRADVKVMSADDVNTGVTGSLSGSDFVITTSNRPIEPGMQVRLAE